MNPTNTKNSANLEIRQLLTQFSDVFQEPKSLPPTEHMITKFLLLTKQDKFVLGLIGTFTSRKQKLKNWWMKCLEVG